MSQVPQVRRPRQAVTSQPGVSASWGDSARANRWHEANIARLVDGPSLHLKASASCCRAAAAGAGPSQESPAADEGEDGGRDQGKSFTVLRPTLRAMWVARACMLPGCVALVLAQHGTGSRPRMQHTHACCIPHSCTKRWALCTVLELALTTSTVRHQCTQLHQTTTCTRQSHFTCPAAQQRSRGNHMLPLEEDGKTIGTACCIGERNLLTARHNIAGPAGRSIVMTGFTAGGRPVR